MGRSSETFSKKEKEKKKQKKRQEKDEKKLERKASSSKGNSLEEMMAYVDEFGNISTTPPDPKKKTVIKAEEIQLGIPRRAEGDAEDAESRGIVTFFNESKGYGFIKDSDTGDSVFVHVKETSEPIREGDRVIFEIEMTPKGPGAIKVRKGVA
jgi:cold shock CspA family protein